MGPSKALCVFMDKSGEGFDRRGGGCRFHGFILFLVFMMTPVLLSCSTRAVQGTPVRDLVLARDPKIFDETLTQRKRDAVSEMSKVKENEVFKEISGIPEYRIGPRDVLKINSRAGEEVTTREITVNDRGKISYSFLDDIDVTGLTPSELDDLLSGLLSDYVRNPRIDILMQEFNSKTATVSGEFSSLRLNQLGQALY